MGLGFLQGRWIMRSFDPSLTFGQAAERTSKIIDEESKDLKRASARSVTLMPA